MRIEIVTPAPPGSLKGNRVTAERWRKLLRRLSHRAAVRESWDGERCDVLVALHARRSLASIERYLDGPAGRLVVTLTGTDLYRDIHDDPRARQVLWRADRLVTLQPLGSSELAPELHGRVRVIHQSAVASRARVARSRRSFDVAVVGHLRPVKDPFRAAEAARLLPGSSRLRIVHAGAALDREMERRARREDERSPRYRWLGGIPRPEVRRLLRRSWAMVLSSRLEGGANVIGEAVVAGCPVLASRIPGSVGLLGEGYPGYFEVGDTEGLAALLRRCEAEEAFRDDLETRCRALQPLFEPDREAGAWRELLAELT